MRPKLTAKGSSRGRRTRRSSRASRRSGAGGRSSATFDAFFPVAMSPISSHTPAVTRSAPSTERNKR